MGKECSELKGNMFQKQKAECWIMIRKKKKISYPDGSSGL